VHRGAAIRLGKTSSARSWIIRPHLCFPSCRVPSGGRRRFARPGRNRHHAVGTEVLAGVQCVFRPTGRPDACGAILAPAAWRGMAAGWAAGVTAVSPRGAANGTVAARRGDPGGHGDGFVPVPQRDPTGGPEALVGLLASWAGQPTEGVDTPAGADRAGADGGLAERCAIGMPGDAGTHLAPHDGHPQLRRPPRDHLRVPSTELEDEGGGRGVQYGVAGSRGRAAAGRWPGAGPAGGLPRGAVLLLHRTGGCAVRVVRWCATRRCCSGWR